MNCDESEVLLHALIDDELDAGHARDVETHISACSACAEMLASFRAMHDQRSASMMAPSWSRSRMLRLPLAKLGAFVHQYFVSLCWLPRDPPARTAPPKYCVTSTNSNYVINL
jgi:anti-sigma factor RsiW